MSSNANGRLALKVIGCAIRGMRERRGQTLEGLAADADISYQYLSGIETGKENFSIRILDKIAVALDISLVALIASAYEDMPQPSRVANAE